MEHAFDPDERPMSEQISVQLHADDCGHNHFEYQQSLLPWSGCPHITCSKGKILFREHLQIGSITFQLLQVGLMTALDSNRVWDESRSFDDMHDAATKLGKVENYLFHECFEHGRQQIINQAAYVVHVEKVYIDPGFRGFGLRLLVMDMLIDTLQLNDEGVLLLQAGTIGSIMDGELKEDLDAVQAYEKLARHWRRMGFTEWSYTDDAWLCLASGKEARPGIRDVVTHLFFRGSQALSTKETIVANVGDQAMESKF